LNLYAVGKITGCFGVKGFVKIRPSTHSLERLKLLREVFVGVSTDSAIPAVVEEVIVNRQQVLIKLKDIDNKTSAENFIGQFMFIDEKELKQPTVGSFFIHEIIGCEVWLKEGGLAGKIVDVYKMPAQDVWVLEKNGKQFLIPAVKEFVKVVDMKKRKIIIDVIEGLIEE